MYNIRINLKEVESLAEQKTLTLETLSFKMISDYLQIISCLMNTPLSYPNDFVFRFYFVTVITDGISFLSSLDCLLYNVKFQNDDQLFDKVILISIFAYVFPFCSYLYWNFVSWIRKLDKENKTRKIWISIIIICYSIQPMLINIYFSYQNCVPLDPSISTLRVKKFLKIVCWDDSHFLYFITLILPNLFIWMIFLPFLLLFKIRVSLKEEIQIGEKKIENQKKLNFSKIFRFSLLGLKENKYYWEFILLLRKYCLILLTIFPIYRNSFTLNLILISWLFLLCMKFQIYLDPYSNRKLHNLTMIYNAILYLTVMLQVLFSLSNLNISQFIIIFVIFSLNGLFLIILFLIIYWARKNTIFSTISKVAKILSSFISKKKESKPMKSTKTKPSKISHGIVFQKEKKNLEQ